MSFDKMFCQVGPFEIFLLTDMAGVLRTVAPVNGRQVLLQCDLSAAGEGAVVLRARLLGLIVVNSHVGLDIRLGLAPVLAEFAAKRFLRGVAVLDMVLQCGGSGTGHVAVRTFVVVHVAPHVVSQVSLYGKLLLTGGALE